MQTQCEIPSKHLNTSFQSTEEATKVIVSVAFNEVCSYMYHIFSFVLHKWLADTHLCMKSRVRKGITKSYNSIQLNR